MVEFFSSPEGRLMVIMTEYDEGDASFIRRYSKKNPGQIKFIPFGNSGDSIKDELKEFFYLQSYHSNLFQKSYPKMLPSVEIELVQIDPSKQKQVDRAVDFLYHGLSLKKIDGEVIEKRSKEVTKKAFVDFTTTPNCYSFFVRTNHKGSNLTIGTFSLVETHNHVYLVGGSAIGSHQIKEKLPYRRLVYLMNGVDLAAVNIASSKPLRFNSTKGKIVQAYESLGYEIIQRINGWRLDLKPQK